MTNFRNLKIVINAQQPLDEVVMSVRDKGYRVGEYYNEAPTHIVTTKGGVYTMVNISGWYPDEYTKTTLAELKEMK